MTWPEVLRWLVLILGSGAGLALTLGRVFRPWMRDEARAAGDKVSAEVKELAHKLATNDLPHLEVRLERQIVDVREGLSVRIDQVRDDLGTRMDRMDERLDRVDRRVERLGEDLNARLDRARQDRVQTEARLLAAIQAIKE